ncbi:unnamed protein product [Choristocarpus tenellus]
MLCSPKPPLLQQEVNFVPNEFNQIQPKKFKESVEFEKVLKIVNCFSN